MVHSSFRLAAGAAIVLVTAPLASAADAPALTAALNGVHGPAIAEHVRVLASDQYEGRAPRTNGEALSLGYIIRAFRDAGLKPAYPHGYLQDVPLVELAQTRPGQVSISAHGQAVAMTPVQDFVTRFGRPQEAVDIQASDLVFAGYGVVSPDGSRDDFAGLDLAGKTVVLLQATPTADGPGADLPAPSSKLSERIDAAAARGARAAILIHTQASVFYPWSVLSGGGAGAKEYFLEPDPKTRKLEGLVFMAEPAARRLFAAAGLDFDQAFQAAGKPGFRPKALDARVDISEAASFRRIVSHNVVAVIPGAEARGQCLMMMAHWDHMGRDPSLKGDQIFNGAVDNATGVGAIIEIGRALQSLPRPRRTIVIAATTAEERGMLGSEYLAAHPICRTRDTVAAVAVDALFPYAAWPAMSMTGYGSTDLDPILAAAARAEGRKLQGDGAPQAGAFFRADNYPFARRGVPGLLAVGNPDGEAGDTAPGVHALVDYVQTKYHHVTDEYDAATWDPRALEGDARTLVRFAWSLANDTRMPRWTSISPYRAVKRPD